MIQLDDVLILFIYIHIYTSMCSYRPFQRSDCERVCVALRPSALALSGLLRPRSLSSLHYVSSRRCAPIQVVSSEFLSVLMYYARTHLSTCLNKNILWLISGKGKNGPPIPPSNTSWIPDGSREMVVISSKGTSQITRSLVDRMSRIRVVVSMITESSPVRSVMESNAI